MSDVFGSPVFYASILVVFSFFVAWVFQNPDSEKE